MSHPRPIVPAWLEIISKLGPVVVLSLTIAGAFVAWGSLTEKTASANAKLDKLIVDVSTISSIVTANSTASQYQRDALTDHARRLLALESERRR